MPAIASPNERGDKPRPRADLWRLAYAVVLAFAVDGTFGHRGVKYVLVRQRCCGASRYAEIGQTLASRCDVAAAGPLDDAPSAVMIDTLLPPRAGCR